MIPIKLTFLESNLNYINQIEVFKTNCTLCINTQKNEPTKKTK